VLNVDDHAPFFVHHTEESSSSPPRTGRTGASSAAAEKRGRMPAVRLTIKNPLKRTTVFNTRASWSGFSTREPVGRVRALDEDAPPFNRIFYFLLPNCSVMFYREKFFVILLLNIGVNIQKSEKNTFEKCWITN
jgi:hypothetical protein